MAIAPRYLATLCVVLLSQLAACQTATAVGADPADSPRQTTVLNADWTYHEGDLKTEKALSPTSEDNWQAVDLPHSFKQPYWMDRIHFGGVGWYRKSINLDESMAGKRVHLQFEGAFQHTWVYVNGELVGEHRGGYTGFTFDITDHVTIGEENQIAIKVSAEWDATIAPRTGDYVFIGGIYRDVYLVATDPVHVPWYGTFVTTPFGGTTTAKTYNLPKSFDAAPVKMVTEVRNDSGSDKNVRVETKIVNATGQIVAEVSSKQSAPASETTEVTQETVIDKPNLWSPDSPYLYAVHTSVYVGDRLTDTYQTPLGVRWFQATADQGLWLNGKPLKLRGFNVHQDHAGWGYAVTDSGFFRDIRLMKNTGANFIRGSHYPKDPSLTEACDQYGLIFMQELAYWGRGGGGGPEASPPADSDEYEPFVENAKQQLREMVRMSRNHPSVLIYSMTNEPTGGQLATTPLSELSHELDPTRPTCRVTNFSHGEADIYGGNGWMHGQGDHPVMFSELWEKEEHRPGTYVGKPDSEPVYSMGTARWAGFDYGTHHDWTLNLVGAFDNARLPKRRYHWHRAGWLGIDPPAWPSEGVPASLSVEVEKTRIGTNGKDDTQVVVTVLDADGERISNGAEVTLSIVSGPGRFPTGKSIDLTAVDGMTGIAVRAYAPGQTVIVASSQGLTSAKVELAFVDGGIHETPQPEAWPTMSWPDAENLALNKPVEASTQEAANTAANAADGSQASRWCAANGEADQWWRVDLGEPTALSGIGITFEQYANYRFVIEVSDNDKDWTVAADHTDTIKVTRRRFVPLSSTARYVRVRYVALPENVWASHTEVEVYPLTAQPLSSSTSKR